MVGWIETRSQLTPSLMCNACEDFQICQLLSLFSAQTNPIGSNGGEDPVSACADLEGTLCLALSTLSLGRDTTPPVIQRKPIFVAVARAAAPAVMERSDGLLKPSLVSLSAATQRSPRFALERVVSNASA
jgi:hypothetical protein